MNICYSYIVVPNWMIVVQKKIMALKIDLQLWLMLLNLPQLIMSKQWHFTLTNSWVQCLSVAEERAQLTTAGSIHCSVFPTLFSEFRAKIWTCIMRLSNWATAKVHIREYSWYRQLRKKCLHVLHWTAAEAYVLIIFGQ